MPPSASSDRRVPPSGPSHIPVLLNEALAGLCPDSQGLYVDATLGLGGHTRALLEQTAPGGRVIGFEWDAEAAAAAGEILASYGDRFLLVPASYADLAAELAKLGIEQIDGLIADLGVSSLQLDRGGRGFSFMADSALDMRMDRRQGLTAAHLLASLPEQELADIFYYYGEERQARRIARHLVLARTKSPVTSTARLAELVAAAVPARYHPPKIHVATRVFQALRIAVNRELENLARLLEDAPRLLRPGGRIAVITFHSLEDRMVKQAFAGKPSLSVVTSRPIVPSPAEIGNNPRARSAKLRIARRTM